MKSTAPVAIALWGILPCLADSSDWQNVVPAAHLMARKPCAPSEALPDRITPIE